jgi:hypothetical protein
MIKKIFRGSKNSDEENRDIVIKDILPSESFQFEEDDETIFMQ